MTTLQPFSQGPVNVTVEGRVAVVTLERGDRLNALFFRRGHGSAQGVVALRLREDTSTSAVVLTGRPVFFGRGRRFPTRPWPAAPARR